MYELRGKLNYCFFSNINNFSFLIFSLFLKIVILNNKKIFKVFI